MYRTFLRNLVDVFILICIGVCCLPTPLQYIYIYIYINGNQRARSVRRLCQLFSSKLIHTFHCSFCVLASKYWELNYN